MVWLVRHRQTKGPETDRLHLNHRATSRLYPLSIKTFGDGSLNAAECRDFGRGSDAEQLVVAGQSPVSQRVAGARAKIGRPAAMVELLSGVRGQAALR
jgi:hypothetical protein